MSVAGILLVIVYLLVLPFLGFFLFPFLAEPSLLRRPKGPTEPCDECGRLVDRKHRVEVLVNVQPGMYGAGGMVATYCKRHAPKEASHA